MKHYERPTIDIIRLSAEDVMQIPGASQFDNDGDGQTDQRPPIIGDPEEIGAKRHLFGYDETWGAWEDEWQ